MSQCLTLEAEIIDDRQPRGELPADTHPERVFLTLAPSPVASSPTEGRDLAPQVRAAKLGPLWNIDDDPEEQKNGGDELLTRFLEEGHIQCPIK